MQNFRINVRENGKAVYSEIRQILGEMGMASEEQIRSLAYAIWQQEGGPEGKDLYTNNKRSRRNFFGCQKSTRIRIDTAATN